MLRTAGLVTALLVAFASVAPAAAQPAPEEPAPAQPAPGDAAAIARAHAASAKAAFDRGDYAAAIANYREAYRLLPSPGLLYNLAQAYRLAGDCGNAAAMYRDYLRLVARSPYRATAEQNLAAAETCAAGTAEPAPAPSPALTASPAPSPPAVPRAAPVRPAMPAAAPRHRRAALVTGGVGVALLAAGAYFAIDAGHAAREVSDLYASGGAWAQVADADARGRRDRTLAIIGLAGGGAALAASAALYWLGRGDREARHVVIAPGRTRADVVVTWQF